MNHVWEYINAYNESTFDQLEHELLSREYEYIRKCPNYEDCLSFCNSMNALNSSMVKSHRKVNLLISILKVLKD